MTTHARRYQPNSNDPICPTTAIWQTIIKNQNTLFHTAKGLPFQYIVTMLPDRTTGNLVHSSILTAASCLLLELQLALWLAIILSITKARRSICRRAEQSGDRPYGGMEKLPEVQGFQILVSEQTDVEDWQKKFFVVILVYANKGILQFSWMLAYFK